MKPFSLTEPSYYVYRIDRIDTGEYYIGIKSANCQPLEDVGYWGSGKRIIAAIKKHGLALFRKTILVQVESWDEASRIEAALVNFATRKDPLMLNLRNGGDPRAAGFVKQTEEERRAAKKAADKAYQATPAGKAAQKAYRATPAGKAVKKAYQATPERKAAKKAYNATPAQKAAEKAYRATPAGKAVRKAARKAYNATPAGKAAQKAANKAYQATPAGKAVRKAYRATPASRVKAAQANRMKILPPVEALREILALDDSSPSGLVWRVDDWAHRAVAGAIAGQHHSYTGNWKVSLCGWRYIATDLVRSLRPDS